MYKLKIVELANLTCIFCFLIFSLISKNESKLIK
jgi:hypothetical protein